VDFKDVAERRAWLLARVEEVERRRNASSKLRQILQNSNRAKVRAYVQSSPGATVQQIASALDLTPAQVWGTDLQHDPGFYQTGGVPPRRGHPVRWWPISHPGPGVEVQPESP
jgi:hypothetical protein